MREGVEIEKTEQEIPQRILILIADIAAGHRASANAIKEAIKLLNPEAEVKVLDLFAELDMFPFNNLEESWEALSRYPQLELIYETLTKVTDIPEVNTLISKLVGMRLIEPTHKIVEAFGPDLIISTYLFTSALLRQFKLKYPQIPTVSVAADLVGFPSLYADINADLVIGATDESAVRYAELGVEPERIATKFFPIHPDIAVFRERDVVLDELGFDTEKPVILITSGGLGIIRLLPEIQKLSEEQDLQLIIIGGKDKSVVDGLKIAYRDNDRIQVFGFVDNMPDYYHVCDVVIGKPGPATVIEIEAHQRKAILTGRVGIQEQGNIDYALENPNFRYVGDEGGRIIPMLRELLDNEGSISFKPRFSFDAAVGMAEEIFEMYKGKQQEKLRAMKES